MGELKNAKKEKFCQLVAMYEGVMSKADMVRECGYGNEDSPYNYFTSIASRFLQELSVQERIREIRIANGIPVDDAKIRGEIIGLLYGIVFADYTKHLGVRDYTTSNGAPRQQVYIKDKDFSTWSKLDRQLTQGFTSGGMPVFLDKHKALTMLTNIVVDMKNNEEIEDLKKLFIKSGLLYGIDEEGKNMKKFLDNATSRYHTESRAAYGYDEDSYDPDKDDFDEDDLSV